MSRNRLKIRVKFKRTKLYLALLYCVSFAFSSIAIFCLWLISPFIKIKIAHITTDRLGHLVSGPETFLRQKQIYGLPARTKYIFIAGKSANEQLLVMWKRHLPIIQNSILNGIVIHSIWLWYKMSCFNSLLYQSNEYSDFLNAKPTLSFTVGEEERGKAGLKKMGIDPEKDWFVCFYVRDSLYLKKTQPLNDWSYHDYRNADINTYKKAVEFIVGSGGYALRMGQYVDKPLSFQHPKIIDYATHFRDDFMDIYLAAKCRFFMGSTAGISDVTLCFDTPRLGINNSPLGNSPQSRNCLSIPKKVKNSKTGEYVPFGKIFSEIRGIRSKALWSVHEFAKLGYEYEDDTEEEIFEAAVEMFERLQGKFVQTEEDKILQEKYFSLIPSDHWTAGVKTPIGRSFLRKYAFLLEKRW